jgi:hypothetical protein
MRVTMPQHLACQTTIQKTSCTGLNRASGFSWSSSNQLFSVHMGANAGQQTAQPAWDRMLKASPLYHTSILPLTTGLVDLHTLELERTPRSRV